MGRPKAVYTKELGGRVALALAKSGQSRRTLSRLLGASPSYSAALIRGDFMPGAEMLVRLAAVLGAPVEWLASGVGRAPTDRAVRAALAAAERRAARAAAAPAPDDMPAVEPAAAE